MQNSIGTEDIKNSLGSKSFMLAKGLRYSEAQAQYGLLINQGLNHAGVGFLEGDTGIGKSLGYLVNAMLLLENRSDLRKKVLISTFTRQLQKQIVDHDVVLARKIVQELGYEGKSRVAWRMGRNSFFSLSRTLNVIASIKPADAEHEAELTAFKDMVIQIIEHGSGLISDYIEQYESLPVGIETKAICLLYDQVIDNPAYDRHLMRAENADILVTNHASLVNFKRTGLDKLHLEAIICDEAHKILGVCEDQFNHRRAVREMTTLLGDVRKNNLNKALNKLIDKSLEQLAVVTASVKRVVADESMVDPYVINEQDNPDLFESVASDLRLVLLNVIKIDKVFENLPIESQKEFHHDHRDALGTTMNLLQNWLDFDNQWSVAAIGVSRELHQVSLASINIHAGRYFGAICKSLTDTVILTSATLSNSGRTVEFSAVKNSLGFTDWPVTVERRLEPLNYGRMEFILTSNEVPNPLIVIDENETVFNTQWLEHCISMIKAAAEHGEPILVLTASHHETKLLAKLMGDFDAVAAQQKGQGINELLPNFIKGETRVLISAGGWEGLNLRKPDGTQLIKHIVVSRIPYPRPDPVFEHTIKKWILKHRKETMDSYLNSIVVGRRTVTAIHKLKQGFGRGIRSEHDAITIWIADPRMPHVNDSAAPRTKFKALINAVPRRFYNQYANAKVFGASLVEQKDKFYL